jgi:hypothetical protein
MKIVEVTDAYILFDNGNKIEDEHWADCCEYNYADYSVLDERTINYDYDFDEDLEFESCEEGFKFGSNGHWIFIPCYSAQNGYYSMDVDILYNGKKVLNTECEFVNKFDWDRDVIDRRNRLKKESE